MRQAPAVAQMVFFRSLILEKPAMKRLFVFFRTALLGMMLGIVLSACGGGAGLVDLLDDETTLKRLEINMAASVIQGKSIPLSAIAYYSDGNKYTLTGSAPSSTGLPAVTGLSWHISEGADKAVITGNQLDAKNTGTVTVTVRDFFSHKTATKTITITPPVVTELALSGLTPNIPISSRSRLALTAEYIYTDGSRKPSSSTRWHSSAPTVASVDAHGVLQAHRAGTATITATDNSNGKRISQTVRVMQTRNTPLFTIGCNAPVTIDSERWNRAINEDPYNATEWIRVDAQSCQTHPVVGLFMPWDNKPPSPTTTIEIGSLFFQAEHHPTQAAAFLPGQLAPVALNKGVRAYSGYMKKIKDSDFNAIYLLAIQ